MAFVSRILLLNAFVHCAVAQAGMEDLMKNMDPAQMKEMMAGMGGGGGGMPPGMGGMPGMGGGMPGMGGGPPQGPPPPPRKEIAVKTARKFMKEVISTLSAEKVQKEIEAATAAAKDKGPQAAMQAMGPIVEKAVSGLVEKYKFEAGFGQAMNSVHEAQKRKNDLALQKALNKFNQLVGMDKIPFPAEEGLAPRDRNEEL